MHNRISGHKHIYIVYIYINIHRTHEKATKRNDEGGLKVYVILASEVS